MSGTESVSFSELEPGPDVSIPALEVVSITGLELGPGLVSIPGLVFGVERTSIVSLTLASVASEGIVVVLLISVKFSQWIPS